MKKILIFACAAVLAFASCGSKTDAPVTLSDSLAFEEVPMTTADSVVAIVQNQISTGDASKIQVALAQLETTYAQLVKEGKIEDAKNYAKSVQEFVINNAEVIKDIVGENETITQLITGIKSLPTATDATAQEAIAAVASQSALLKELLGSKDVEAVTSAVASAVSEDVKTQVKEAVDEKKTELKEAARDKAKEQAAKVIDGVLGK